MHFRRYSLKKRTSLLTGSFLWSWQCDLNTRPADYESAALPAELCQRTNPCWEYYKHLGQVCQSKICVKSDYRWYNAGMCEGTFSDFCIFRNSDGTACMQRLQNEKGGIIGNCTEVCEKPARGQRITHICKRFCRLT